MNLILQCFILLTKINKPCYVPKLEEGQTILVKINQLRFQSHYSKPLKSQTTMLKRSSSIFFSFIRTQQSNFISKSTREMLHHHHHHI
ncbi:hypothetical protein GLOIN_2v1740603 [Rhizophagus irregularis DAOM 181602=DAOM 197198]|uniref:Uncharacterized protein n=1 Tax=Rhizophagus irregularis (strain DAOM 181602 / DAOM 197198 / MUCL 43194) TaxID=747089 RepID=A0A2P4NK31_RHIID|nr:hypothetical protein GLOIN_2v1740603 [Rhizophagus irregularis DAOM 181602=DAOM 197198]POG53493.1 hypothetical protein GLOIN_2v1740603 [Rhizophagus irregularis DAOM 181602=DAOM 197198]GET55285.1 hypothetical protein GLOIN_2v1740603 [Rhizophagus irregularis DAOM 181602=DAOM 197198]|eukprot:XP_025164100.1 hypothetical protein GLOIN_2v1740603 [Rhizophagus irregularis DAOM 181602=DAOM 197198]